MAQDIKYLIDGVDLSTYGVFVSASKGILSRPKSKTAVKENWTAQHGATHDLSTRYVEERTITLDCFIKTTGGPSGFAQSMNNFLSIFSNAGTRRLSIVIDQDKPLVFEVYLDDSVDPDKIWESAAMVGTFRLILKEPSPVKRVLKFVRTSGNQTATITVTSEKILTVYWGDGSVTDDVYGESQTITHTFTTNGTFFIIVAGVIEEIELFTTNATVVWEKI